MWLRYDLSYQLCRHERSRLVFGRLATWTSRSSGKWRFLSSLSQLQWSGFEMKPFCQSRNSSFHRLQPTDPSSTSATPRDDPEEPEAADVCWGFTRTRGIFLFFKSTKSFSSAQNIFLARFPRKWLQGFVSHSQETLSCSGTAKKAAKKLTSEGSAKYLLKHHVTVVMQVIV